MDLKTLEYMEQKVEEGKELARKIKIVDYEQGLAEKKAEQGATVRFTFGGNWIDVEPGALPLLFDVLNKQRDLLQAKLKAL